MNTYLSTFSWHARRGGRCVLKRQRRMFTGSAGKDSSTADWVRIGDVKIKVKASQSKTEKVPQGYLDEGNLSALSPTMLRHLRWMMQKDLLKQDMFLIGPPGPSRRWLAMSYAQLLQRDVEVVAISRDSTESDLKQRREIIEGSAIFVDQAPGMNSDSF